MVNVLIHAASKASAVQQYMGGSIYLIVVKDGPQTIILGVGEYINALRLFLFYLWNMGECTVWGGSSCSDTT